jgi:hypothetical protein
MEQLYGHFIEGRITQGLILYLSNAFDTINHSVLISKQIFFSDIIPLIATVGKLSFK